MSERSLCFRADLILPERTLESGYLMIRNGRITGISTSRPSDVSAESVVEIDGYLSPGFLDFHVHGGDGADYMDGTPDAVRTANRAHLRHGTTTIFPTTTTGSSEQLQRMFDACRSVTDTWTIDDGASIGGIHFYGPYFAEEKVGCHSKDGRRNPVAREYEHFLSTGMIRVATCAAELPGSEAFYRAASRAGCLVTCGHSDASWQEMQRAFDSGMRHVDHFWCAMSSVVSLRARFGSPMQASMEQFVLATTEMSTEVIADGQHLSPELLEFAYRMMGPRRLCLVTDSNRAMDQPPGQYRFGSKEDGPLIESNGQVGYVPGQGLASSVVGMDTMVRTMAAQTTAPLHDVVRMATLTSAERLGLADQIGSLEEGKRADLVYLSRDLHVRQVFHGGVKAYSI